MPILLKESPGHTARPAVKMNRQKALSDARRGMSDNDIAKSQGINQSTVSRFMQRVKPERKALESFKEHRADILARLQAKSLDAQERLMDTLNDGVIGALKTQQIPGLILALNASHGTNFDKERLQRGQSTSNQSIISRMLDETVKDLYKTPQRVVVQHDSADHHGE